MISYADLFERRNLLLAYKWVLSNPEWRYKAYFRDAYSAFAASSQQNLHQLQDRLRKEVYEATHASKVYLAKPSGILRPYTLLTVNDQIVYQACANLVAKALYPRIRTRYYRSVFGHMYAGSRSNWFYRQWRDGYRAYTKKITEFIDEGFTEVATFDLTAFYDSIDHNTLRHFLQELNLEPELIEFMMSCLQVWTSSTWTNVRNVIYQRHGIPQGPLSSGIFSEVMLKHLDDRAIRGGGSVRYIRYVDDIHLFASDSSALRKRLISLDLASKEIGLFPQSSKIQIRTVKSAREEVKNLSLAPSRPLRLARDPQKAEKRLLELSRRGRINSENLTEFKYLLGAVKPSYRLSSRILRLLDDYPDMAEKFGHYFARYDKFPTSLSESLSEWLCKEHIYHASQGELLKASIDRLQEEHLDSVSRYCHMRLTKSSQAAVRIQPTLKAAMIAAAVAGQRFTFKAIEKLLSKEQDWWVRKDVIKYILPNHFGAASYSSLISNLLCHKDIDTARQAAALLVEHQATLTVKPKAINPWAKLLLWHVGIVRSKGKPPSVLGEVLDYVLGTRLVAKPWERYLGKQAHHHAELLAVNVKKHYEANIDACIVALDSLCDHIFAQIYAKHLPKNKYPSYGAALKNSPTLTTAFPKLVEALRRLHELRLESATAHPNKKNSNNRRLKHADFRRIRPILAEGLNELDELNEI